MMAKQSSLDDVGLELDNVEQEEDYEASSGGNNGGDLSNNSSRYLYLEHYF